VTHRVHNFLTNCVSKKHYNSSVAFRNCSRHWSCGRKEWSGEMKKHLNDHLANFAPRLILRTSLTTRSTDRDFRTARVRSSLSLPSELPLCRHFLASNKTVKVKSKTFHARWRATGAGEHKPNKRVPAEKRFAHGIRNRPGPRCDVRDRRPTNVRN